MSVTGKGDEGRDGKGKRRVREGYDERKGEVIQGGREGMGEEGAYSSG